VEAQQEQHPLAPRRKKRHRQQYIDSIVKLATIDKVPVHQLAEQSGVCPSQIYRWIHKQQLQVARQDPGSEASVQAELREVRRENEDLKEQVAFLKKAATYFASQSPSDISSSASTKQSTP
jgi:transposase